MFGKFFKKLSVEEKVKALADEIIRETETDSYELVVKPDCEAGIFSSKFGGIPYWDEKNPYPVDINGHQMQLLAQYNFSEIEYKNEKLPENGILQFFIPSDRIDYGMNLSNAIDSGLFKVVYQESVDTSINEESVRKVCNLPGYGNEFSPVIKPIAFGFEHKKSWIRTTSAGFNDCFSRACKKILKIDFDGEDYSDLLDGENFCKGKKQSENFRKIIDRAESSCLGYPSFCQGDIRETKKEYSSSVFDTLLLQIDSTKTCGKVNFGDAGIAQFFINSKNLMQKDFSKVLYNWDCY